MKYSELKNYQNWIIDQTVDHDLFKQIQLMSEEELYDSFSRSLEFGTAGLRGIMGPGSNRMNIYTIRKAALAFGRYLLATDSAAKTKGVVIAYDNRFMSKRFYEETASILTGLGILTYGFDGMRSTPQLSFSVRHLGCVGGVVITASHNPKQYNGFKVYDHEGCQLTPDLIEKVYPYYYDIANELSIKIAPNYALWRQVRPEVDEAYYQALLGLRIHQKLPNSDIKVVFSPQHGTGFTPMKFILETLHYQAIYVAEQCVPDPNFSKTISPNPEDKNAYQKALDLAKANDAHLILTTDPDADRIGVVEMIEGHPVYFSGNQIGALLIDYILKFQNPGKQGIVFDTIVTSRFGSKIASNYGVKVQSTLTGFKFIGEQIAKLSKSKKFVFGYEESFGYLLAPFVRDKDAFQAAVMILEMKTYYHSKQTTLQHVLQELYSKHGYFLDEVISLHFDGPQSAQKLSDLMKKVRTITVQDFGGINILVKEDYLTGKASYPDGGVRKLKLPSSNVIRYILQDGSEISIRPSGTEPKCKLYFNVVGADENQAKQKSRQFIEAINHLLVI